MDGGTLAFDIGGTFIRAGVYDAGRGGITHRISCRTPNYLTMPDAGPEVIIDHVLAQAASLGGDLCGDRPPAQVIVGYPGPIDRLGRALRSPTILGPRLDCAADVTAAAGRHWQRSRVRVINDLTAAGYYFVSRGYRDFCVLTVGSGIGNKVFVGGEPIVGAEGLGGEVGHLAVPWSPLAQGGNIDLGELASARAMIRTYVSARRNSPLGQFLNTDADGEDFVDALQRREAEAVRILEGCVDTLGQVIGCIHLALGTSRFFLLGGLVCALGESFRLPLVERIRASVWDLGQDFDSMVALARLDADEGLAGAGYFATRQAEAARS